MSELEREILRRRTFAIISHPDAGKTTMTEKILLHGGAINIAGAVHGKKTSKVTVSDWMKIEQERGISVSTSVMNLDYDNFCINILDTPGHADFGEDTYRTLTAVDNALMLIDNAKGVETQTKKLYEVCRLRHIPLYTFINKMDRNGRSNIELLDEIEKLLNVDCFPVTWPIGSGDSFKGVYDRINRKIHLYSSAKTFKTLNSFKVTTLDDPEIRELINDDHALDQFLDEMELMEGMMQTYDLEAFLKGKVTLVFFGSAQYDFGIDLFLNHFINTSSAPLARNTSEGSIEPIDQNFSGFVFKIQANLDKNHRDRLAFVRIISGKFERGMNVTHARLNLQMNLKYSHQFFANKRETAETAYAGDIIGIHEPGNLQIGDTLYQNKRVVFEKIPSFPPELFAKIQILDLWKRKQLSKGIQQLCEEGTIQKFIDPSIGDQDPILAAVGQLQFEVLIYRLQEEYGVSARIIKLALTCARWIERKNPQLNLPITGNILLYEDIYKRPVALFENQWNLNWVIEKNPEIVFHEIAPII